MSYHHHRHIILKPYIISITVIIYIHLYIHTYIIVYNVYKTSFALPCALLAFMYFFHPFLIFRCIFFSNLVLYDVQSIVLLINWGNIWSEPRFIFFCFIPKSIIIIKSDGLPFIHTSFVICYRVQFIFCFVSFFF